MFLKCFLFFKAFSMFPLPQATLGDSLVLFFQSVYFLRSLNLGRYNVVFSVFFILLVVVIVAYLIYITVDTFLMKKNVLMMSSVLKEEGEVIEITDDYGKQGWIFIYGENWRFVSKDKLKLGDLVRVVKNKKLKLIVEKVEDSL